MAPKKQQKKGGATSKSAQSGNRKGGNGPKMELSEENQRRIRQLLLNSGHSALPSSTPPSEPSMTRAQKTKKIRAIYDRLSCEGFTPDQIESALTALNDAATFEAALDWLCLHVPGNDLPLKFSSGKSASSGVRGSVNVLSVASPCDEWVPQHGRCVDIAQPSFIPFKSKGVHGDDGDENLLRPSDADWIRQYVKKQAEEEQAHVEAYAEHNDLAVTDEDMLIVDANNDSLGEIIRPGCHASSIAEEFEKARLVAMEAKAKGDKEKQERAGQLIRRLKHEISSIGLSNLIYEVNARTISASRPKFETNSSESATWENQLGEESRDFFISESSTTKSEPVTCLAEKSSDHMNNLDDTTVASKTSVLHGEPESLNADGEIEDANLCGLFSDDTIASEVSFMPSKLPNHSNKTVGKDTLKMPKALLHQQCQKLGWEAPTYRKLSARENTFIYNVSVLCKPRGRGKNRKAGGLVKFDFPDQEVIFNSVERAVNVVQNEVVKSIVQLLMEEEKAKLTA